MNRYIEYIDVKYEVIDALRCYKPVVALETSTFSNGMPWSENFKMAMELEDIVRNNGATPATMAIIDGRLKIGLEDHEIELLAKSKNAIKTRRKDLPWVISKKLTGVTTVASTMLLASMAGIRVIASIGIGGVHQGAVTSFDVSSDLTELGQTDVAVICSGIKSKLDIGLTLEKLETLGVPVIGYRTSEFPSFDIKKSGFTVDISLNSPIECAKMLKVKWDLDLTGGVVIAAPIPQELVIKEGLENNVSIVKNNASIAAKIAVAFAKLDEHRKSAIG